MCTGAFLKACNGYIYTTSYSEAVWILIQYQQKVHVFHSVWLSAFPPTGWNAGCAFIFIQMGNMYMHEMWEMTVVITKILAWEKIQLQKNKNRFSMQLGNCQNMSIGVLKNPSPIFFWHSEFWDPLMIFETTSPTPEKAARSRKNSCIRGSRSSEGRKIQLLSQLTFGVHLVKFYIPCMVFSQTVYCCILYLYSEIGAQGEKREKCLSTCIFFFFF